MYVRAALKTIVILCALAIPALGALTTEQIGVDLNNLASEATDVNNYAKAQSFATGDIDTSDLVDDINSLEDLVDALNSNLPGSAQQTTQEQSTIIATLQPFIDAFTALINTLDDKVTSHDFLLPDDLTSIKNAVQAVVDAVTTLLTELGALGSALEDDGEFEDIDYEGANEQLGNDIDNEMVAKKFRFKRD